MSEAHVPTQYSPPGEEPRVPSSNVDARGPGHSRRPAPQGPDAAERLKSEHLNIATQVWRLRGRRNIESVRRARRSGAGAVSVRFAPAPAGAATPPEVGYAVGRVVGTAVARNRLRRRLRAVIAAFAADLAPGRYLLGAGPQAAHLSVSELTAAVCAGLTAAGALRTDAASSGAAPPHPIATRPTSARMAGT